MFCAIPARFQDLPGELVSGLGHSANQFLRVPQCVPDFPNAADENIVCYRYTVPNVLEQLLLGDYPVPVLHKIQKSGERLRAEAQRRIVLAADAEAPGVQNKVLKPVLPH
jgi:hypothetical protein